MGEAKHRVGIFGNMLNFLQERSTKDGQTRQKLLLAFNYFGKNEIIKKGVEEIMIFGICIGFLLGALVVNVYLKESEQTNDLLKKTINNLEDDIDLANSKIENRDNLLKDYQEEHEILLNNASELRAKIKDLENNIELLANNLSDKNKELISDYQSQN